MIEFRYRRCSQVIGGSAALYHKQTSTLAQMRHMVEELQAEPRRPEQLRGANSVRSPNPGWAASPPPPETISDAVGYEVPNDAAEPTEHVATWLDSEAPQPADHGPLDLDEHDYVDGHDAAATREIIAGRVYDLFDADGAVFGAGAAAGSNSASGSPDAAVHVHGRGVDMTPAAAASLDARSASSGVYNALDGTDDGGQKAVYASTETVGTAAAVPQRRLRASQHKAGETFGTAADAPQRQPQTLTSRQPATSSEYDSVDRGRPVDTAAADVSGYETAPMPTVRRPAAKPNQRQTEPATRAAMVHRPQSKPGAGTRGASSATGA